MEFDKEETVSNVTVQEEGGVVEEAVQEEGEALPEVFPVTDAGVRKGTMINVSFDTHKRLKEEKARLDVKSFDALIRKAFEW